MSVSKETSKAASETESKRAKNGATEPTFTDAPPEGFEDVGRPEIDGWLKAEEGLVVFGKICGFFSYMKQQRGQKPKRVDVVCFKLFQACKAAPEQEGGPARTLNRGQVLAASMMYALDDIRPYIEHRGDVWIRFGKKTSLGSGQFVWKAEVKCRGKKGAPPVAQIQTAPQADDSEGGEFEGVADYDFS